MADDQRQQAGRDMDVARMRLGQAVKALAAGRKTMGRDHGWADPKDWVVQCWEALNTGLGDYAPLPLAWSRAPIETATLVAALRDLQAQGWALPIHDDTTAGQLASALQIALTNRRAG